MLNLYGVLKFLHVVSVVLWIGGVTALWLVTLRMARAGDYAAVTRLQPVVTRYGQSVVGPASGIVLITGIWMAVIGELLPTPWVAIGFTGILIHFILGATLVRRNWMQLGKLAADPARDDARFRAIVSRTAVTSSIYLLVMIAVIAAMVLKPSG